MELGTRKPCVAGQFYDSNPERLASQIKQLLDDVEKPDDARKAARALILPHAGYTYSAETAISALALAARGKYEEIMVIAPSHRVPFHGLAVAGYESYSTPLGDMTVDEVAINALLECENEFISNLPQAHQHEHSLEVELPLLQQIIGNIKLIPLVAGFVTSGCARQLVEALKQFWKPEILWIISSDFTHYGSPFRYVPFKDDIQENLRELDMKAVKHILDLDLDGFDAFLENTGATICGAGPIKILLAILTAAAADGEDISGELTDYTTSGALTGDFSHCVSYAGMAFY